MLVVCVDHHCRADAVGHAAVGRMADVGAGQAIGETVWFDVAAVRGVLAQVDGSWHGHHEGWCWQTVENSPWWR